MDFIDVRLYKMNVDMFQEVMVFDGISMKINDRILYSFNEELPERFKSHFHTWVVWIQSYIDDFLKRKTIDNFPYNVSIHYEIKGDSLFLVDGENRYEFLTYGTEKPEVRRGIAIGAFESYLATV